MFLNVPCVLVGIVGKLSNVLFRLLIVEKYLFNVVGMFLHSYYYKDFHFLF